jgi:hypothetical protein
MEKVNTKQLNSIAKLQEPLNNENWSTWNHQIAQVINLGDIFNIMNRKIKKLAATHADLDTWTFNDKDAQCLITKSVAKSQMMHIRRLKTSHKMWMALRAIHELKGHQTKCCSTIPICYCC